MSALTRVFDGRFGRLVLNSAALSSATEGCPDPRIVILFDGDPIALRVGKHRVPFSRNELLLLNPGQSAVEQVPGAGTRLVMLQASNHWLQDRFPAVFGGPNGTPFQRPCEAITARIRRLADALAFEVLNDQFLSPDRLEFMLQELMLSLVESYMARRRASSPLWKGSRFADSRIRHALALLRAQPNKDLNMDRVATAVGLSRSRFYDLFQVCTGLAPRAYLDMLCIEAAITRLASGKSRISEVSAELGFSAQSNFTRFFLNRVGVPPSTYRRASTRESESQQETAPAIASEPLSSAPGGPRADGNAPR